MHQIQKEVNGYGPKPKDHCLCENDVECKDLKGCR